MISLFPTPQLENAPTGTPNSFVGRNESRNDDQYHVRIDQKLNDNTTIFGRYSTYNSPILSPLGYAELSTASFLLKSKNVAVGITHSFSPQTLNEARFGYNNDRFE